MRLTSSGRSVFSTRYSSPTTSRSETAGEPHLDVLFLQILGDRARRRIHRGDALAAQHVARHALEVREEREVGAAALELPPHHVALGAQLQVAIAEASSSRRRRARSRRSAPAAWPAARRARRASAHTSTTTPAAAPTPSSTRSRGDRRSTSAARRCSRSVDARSRRLSPRRRRGSGGSRRCCPSTDARTSLVSTLRNSGRAASPRFTASTPS